MAPPFGGVFLCLGLRFLLHRKDMLDDCYIALHLAFEEKTSTVFLDMRKDSVGFGIFFFDIFCHSPI